MIHNGKDQLSPLFTLLMNNQNVINALKNWGKKIKITIDDKEFQLDFSKREQDSFIHKEKSDFNPAFHMQTTMETLLSIFKKEINPLEAYTSGLLTIDGSLLEAMEFAELILEFNNSQQ